MLGITTPCVMRVKATLESQGYEVVPFHANGTSGPAMEQLIEQGKFAGVIDLSTHEVIDQQHGGLAGAPNRLEALTRTAIPAVISVGGSDYVLFESMQKAPEKYRSRPHMVHNAQMTCFAPTADEMVAAAREMIERLNRALGPTIVVLPGKGFSRPNQEGVPPVRTRGQPGRHRRVPGDAAAWTFPLLRGRPAPQRSRLRRPRRRVHGKVCSREKRPRMWPLSPDGNRTWDHDWQPAPIPDVRCAGGPPEIRRLARF